MTVVAIHRISDQKIYAMADSLVSDRGPLISHVCKLFKLQVSVSAGDGHKANGYELGFAFAGSSLLALSGYGMISAAMYSLFDEELAQTSEQRLPKLPSIREVVDFSMQVFAKIVANLGDWKGPNAIPKSNLCFFGFCPIEQKLVAYTIEPKFTNNKLYFVQSELHFPEDGHALFFGDQAACKEVIKHRGLGLFKAMSKVIADENFASVGGDVQVIVATDEDVHFPVVLREDEDGTVSETLIGFDVQKETVGGLRVGAYGFGRVNTGGEDLARGRNFQATTL